MKISACKVSKTIFWAWKHNIKERTVNQSSVIDRKKNGFQIHKRQCDEMTNWIEYYQQIVKGSSFPIWDILWLTKEDCLWLDWVGGEKKKSIFQSEIFWQAENLDNNLWSASIFYLAISPPTSTIWWNCNGVGWMYLWWGKYDKKIPNHFEWTVFILIVM